MEVMGLHLPGAAFVNPGTPLREALTTPPAPASVELTALGGEYTPIGEVVDEKAIVNGVVALLATGGSTNHTMHLVAIAAAAGITLDLGRHRGPVRGRAAAGARLPQRHRGREPLPRRRRHWLLHRAHAARRRACCTTT